LFLFFVIPMKKRNFVPSTQCITHQPTTLMKKQIRIEQPLKCRSHSIIWPLLSTDSGLQKWIADEVTQEGNRLSFTWGEPWGAHETRTATMAEQVRGRCVRFIWDDEPSADDNYWELAIERSDVTGDYVLIITDHALPEDVDALNDIWEQNLDQLHHSTGL
jgi:hypothetical protein